MMPERCLAVDDIQQASKRPRSSGAAIAYPPPAESDLGTLAES